MHRIVDIKVIDELVDPTVTRGPTSVHTGKFFGEFWMLLVPRHAPGRPRPPSTNLAKPIMY